MVAKNDVAHRELSKQFAARTVEKIYLALVTGKLRKAAGVIEENIGRHPVHRQRMRVTSLRGRAAKTEYRVIRSSDQASLVECRLHRDAPIKFACTFIISVTRCSATKFMRRASRKISRAKCCTHGSWASIIRASANGKILKRRCLRISNKLLGLSACEYQCRHAT